jgi:integrase
MLPADSPSELAQPRVADPEVMTHLVNDRPPNLLDDLGIAVAHRADGTPVDRDPVRQGAGVERRPKGLRDPSNTQADLKDSLEWCGLPWVTSHVFRKTTATLLDGAGLSARSIADQLGHAHPSITQNVYMGRKIASTEAASVLEQFG